MKLIEWFSIRILCLVNAVATMVRCNGHLYDIDNSQNYSTITDHNGWTEYNWKLNHNTFSHLVSDYICDCELEYMNSKSLDDSFLYYTSKCKYRK